MAAWHAWAAAFLLIAFTGCQQEAKQPDAQVEVKKNAAAAPSETPIIIASNHLIGTNEKRTSQPGKGISTNLVTRTRLTAPIQTSLTNFSLTFPRPATNTFEAQVALARVGISCGSIDGLMGAQTRAAFQAFQKAHQLPDTGLLDEATRPLLVLESSPLTNYVIQSRDLSRLQPLSETWVGKSKQSALDYTNVLELVAEKTKSHPRLLKELNPGIKWEELKESESVLAPAADYPPVTQKAVVVKIALSQRVLEAFGDENKLLAHFPCSIARNVEKRPVGELQVSVVAPNPNYTFDPALFSESPEAKTISTKLVIPPGPNNPVGTVWIGLNKPGYGIHGTPHPEQVGRTESHGCFRLANWNAEYLLTMVSIGTKVIVEDKQSDQAQ
jgi:lipoprotein-anchoring transpeptidase ErfK/SrfK